MLGTSRARRLTKRPGVKTQQFVTYMGISVLVAVLLVSLLLALSSAAAGAAVSPVEVGVAASAISGAAGTVGAAAGFLFGLPRSRFADDPTDALGRRPSAVAQSHGVGSAELASAASTSAATQRPATQNLTAASSGSVPSMRYLTNSNLIKVSDWLTTIIIGLGLVNLADLIPGIRRLGNTLKAPLGGTSSAATVGVSLVIGVGLASFLLTYLWTSIRVRELLEDTERQAEKDVVPQLEGSRVRRAVEDIAATSLQLSISNIGKQVSALEDAVVTTQNPASGTLVPRGSQVTISAQ